MAAGTRRPIRVRLGGELYRFEALDAIWRIPIWGSEETEGDVMPITRFEHFGHTALGKRLAALIDTPDRYVEFRAFSREGFPAVTALVSVLTPVLEPLRRTDPAQFDAAKQFVGWLTGVIMRRHQHVIVRKSASVPGKLFNVAAVWSGEPSNLKGDSQEDSEAA